MNQIVKNDNTELNRRRSRNDLMELIKKAKNDISMIGTIAFNISWNEIIDVVKDKFVNKDFTIHILRESETEIAQYALLTISQENKKEDTGSLSRGNLTGIKEKVMKELKEELIEANDGKNIEPPEDKYAAELGKVYFQTKRLYLLGSYQLNKCKKEFELYIKEKLEKAIGQVEKAFMSNPQFIAQISGAIEENPDFVKCYVNDVKHIIQDYKNKMVNSLGDLEVLKECDFSDISEVTSNTNKEGITSLNVSVIATAQGIELEEKIQIPIEKWIEDFRLSDESNDKNRETNYRIDADKIQANRRAAEEKKKVLEQLRKNSNKKQRLFIKNCYMPIPVPMIKIDDELFITQALTQFDSIDKFQYVGNLNQEGGYESLWIREFRNYYYEYFENINGAQKYSTEETAKGNRKEVIDIFDENRSRIGIGPRDAFLSNMAIVKSVVWALIFDREGRILIHQRAANAKDNQGLWDKSVGGHVSTEDLDTIESIKREIAEELFTIENEGQSGHDIVQWMVTNKNKIIYLGDWKVSRFPDLKALNLKSDEYYNFSLNYPDVNRRDFRREIVITERLLPNGERVKAKCFVDAYLCIVSEDFNVKRLENSSYALLSPNELKRCVLKREIKLNDERKYDADNGKVEEFKPTSDLAYLVESAIWDDIVTEFAMRVKETFK